jgi:hypothetical protein
MVISFALVTILSRTEALTGQFANSSDDGVRVILTLFGVNEETGKVAAMVKVQNMTEAKLVNASSEYILRNQTGVIDIYFQIANQSILVGEPITACVVVFQIPQMACNSGFNSPGIRSEFIQIMLPNPALPFPNNDTSQAFSSLP